MAKYYIRSEPTVIKHGDVIFDGTSCVFCGLSEDILRVSAQIVLDKLKEIDLFCGKYDAKNGGEHYMYGISTVMEVIANYAGDEEFEDMFLKNMIDSEEKVE